MQHAISLGTGEMELVDWRGGGGVGMAWKGNTVHYERRASGEYEINRAPVNC